MVQCSTSLWSADLANLAAEIKRVEPFSERFHLDVADGHYVPALLFFPDMVLSLRPHTRLPLEVHLMTAEPRMWIEPFAEAGADAFIFCFDTLGGAQASEAADIFQTTRGLGKQVGVSLTVDEPVDLVEPFLRQLDILTVIGTRIGIKGASMDPRVPDKIREARRMVLRQGTKTMIQADGGIRRESVPLMAAAGVDCIVPGSLMFREDPPQMRAWLETLS